MSIFEGVPENATISPHQQRKLEAEIDSIREYIIDAEARLNEKLINYGLNHSKATSQLCFPKICDHLDTYDRIVTRRKLS